MKRMYVILGLIVLTFVWAITSLAQKFSSSDVQLTVQQRQPFDRQKRRMELREEMHRRMRANLLHGQGSSDQLFGSDMEKLLEEAMADSFADMDMLSDTPANFQAEWQSSKAGRTLIITPQNKDQQLNIDVNEEAITIKGKSEQKNGNSTFLSSFTNSFPVPDDCDGSKVKMDQKDGKILVQLPFKAARAVTVPPKEERRPLPPSESDVQI